MPAQEATAREGRAEAHRRWLRLLDLPAFRLRHVLLPVCRLCGFGWCDRWWTVCQATVQPRQPRDRNHMPAALEFRLWPRNARIRAGEPVLDTSRLAPERFARLCFCPA